MATDVYVIIVTYNPKKWIDVCFNSLRNSSIPIKTIVIDNGSTDGSASIIKEKFPEVDFIQSEKNLGFGKANNIGIKKAYEAGANYVFLLNQDAWIQEDTITKLVSISHQNPKFGIISPIHLNGNGDALDYGFSNYILPKKCEGIYSDAFLNKLKDQVYPVQFVNAASWFMTREVIEKVGGFSPSFFHYGEDDNYCQRVLFQDFKIGIYPKTIIYHDREQRVKSVYFTNPTLYYTRKIIFEFSNPKSNKRKISLYKAEIKGLYLGLLTLNLSMMKSYLHNIKVLNAINFKEIQKNRDLTKLKGATFLNL
ncbi:glycosyltransferase family 2 protein [Flavobacterium sp.]|uniref:glycosyltransferase family 2 protein n=1 Tax=Flavobacterium sp. TaxID=239 RepID=UPI00262D0551|nr:glycosyltransferase family 2 protein [Flavobacterium sp.]